MSENYFDSRTSKNPNLNSYWYEVKQRASPLKARTFGNIESARDFFFLLIHYRHARVANL